MDSLEKITLPRFQNLAKRLNDSTLILNIDNNDKMVFVDKNDNENVERIIKHYLIDYDETNKAYILGECGWEWESSSIILNKSGKRFDLLSRPKFNDSHSMFLCCESNDMDERYGIQIWKITINQVVKVYDTTLSGSAVPVTAIWQNDSTIEGCLKSYEDDSCWTFIIKFHNGNCEYFKNSDCLSEPIKK